MRILAIDFGEKRIGLAMTDPDGRLAVALQTLTRVDDLQIVAEIEAITIAESIELLVVGEPLNLDGSRGEGANRIRRFAGKLKRQTGLPCRLVNESLTSHEAEQRLRQAGVDVRRHPERVDAVAAQILLQEALDSGELKTL